MNTEDQAVNGEGRDILARVVKEVIPAEIIVELKTNDEKKSYPYGNLKPCFPLLITR